MCRRLMNTGTKISPRVWPRLQIKVIGGFSVTEDWLRMEIDGEMFFFQNSVIV